MTNQEEILKKYKRLSALYHVIVGPVNDMVNTAMIDAVGAIKTTKYYKFKNKQLCNKAIEGYKVFERANYNDMINRAANIDKRQLYMDFLDSVAERVNGHVANFRMAIKQLLDKHNKTDTQIKSTIICANELVKYAVFIFDDFFDKAPKTGNIMLRETFADGRLTACKHNWGLLTEAICSDCGDIDIESDDNCKLSFQIIERQMTSEKYINDSGMEAIELNPEIKKEIDNA